MGSCRYSCCATRCKTASTLAKYAPFSRPIFVSARLIVGLHVQPLRRRSDRLLASSSHFNGPKDSGWRWAPETAVIYEAP